MAWANTFSGLLKSRLVPRTDCPLTLPEIPLAKEDDWLIQRAKPLNDHLEAQLLYYCTMNYPEEQRQGLCPGRKELISNQGLASDWIAAEHQKFRAALNLK